ncbi:MAG TPA: flagellar basal-body MS-ring/collar protein FliF [Anaerovoracaceae bacterium]|nr:flagellar basal-body MS-ring/collar protein FliF [Anaerovoracaceae bacterium]
MNEQIRKTLAPLTQFWANTSKTVKRVVIGGVIIAVIVALVLSILLNSKDYVVIFDQLSETESSEILAALQGMDVEVKVDNNGAIMVLKEDESKVRMQLATEGYPKSGLSYYLIQENSGMLTTDYERKQYVNMQLQERIGASIKTLDGVKDAVVTITVPEDDVFYLQEKEKPTASVIIHMKPGSTLTDGQVLGIQNLVAKSVSGLSKDDIALSDSLGNDLIESSTSRNPDFSKITVTREIENDIRKKVSAVLLGPYKSEQFKVSVSATVDTDALVQESTIYSPSPDGNNSGVISEETRNSESSSSTQGNGGVAGTSSNSEVPTYPTGGSAGESTSATSGESIKYQVSQTKSQSQKAGAKVQDVSIGIAIDKASFDPGERESITQLVAYAAGVSPASISVQNFQFYQEAPAGPTEPAGGINKLILFGGIGAGVLVLGSLIALILMKRRKKGVEEEANVMAGVEDAEGALDTIFGEAEQADVIKPIKPVQDVRREEIKQFAKTNPEIAAQMIKTWLRSEE